MTEIIKTNGNGWGRHATKPFGLSHDEVVYIGDDYGLGGNDESVYKSDYNYLTIDNYLNFPEVVKGLL